MLSPTIPSPVQRIDYLPFHNHEVAVFIKREDLIHPDISGNKWRKLKYNLAAAKSGIITFGGAFSNHLHATAAAGFYYKIPTVGLIRGSYDRDNPTLKDCLRWGMQLHFIDRQSYRLKEGAPAVQEICRSYPDYMLLPEGGSNAAAERGVHEMAAEIEDDYDLIVLSAGTGATARGIAAARPHQEILIISSMKGPDLAGEWKIRAREQFTINQDYHFGGFGKTDNRLIAFINSFSSVTGIPLDPVYNAKVLYGLHDMAVKGRLTGKKILVIHTGGLQGIKAYNYLARKQGKEEIEGW